MVSELIGNKDRIKLDGSLQVVEHTEEIQTFLQLVKDRNENKLDKLSKQF